MSYLNAKNILPPEVLSLIQEYIEGEVLYVPRKDDEKKPWGANTNTKTELEMRNRSIYLDYCQGVTQAELAERYFLSIKSIQRIIRDNQTKLFPEPESA